MTNERMPRRLEVERVSGLSQASIYRLGKLGQFPKPRRIGPRTSAWVAPEIEAWVRAKAEGEASRPVPPTDRQAHHDNVLRAMLDGKMSGTIVLGARRGVKLMPIGKPYTVMPG